MVKQCPMITQEVSQSRMETHYQDTSVVLVTASSLSAPITLARLSSVF